MTIVTRAAVLREPDEPYSIEEVTLADLRPDQVLVEIAGVGMCHTDILPRDPQLGASLRPLILGHEGSGVVVEVGSAVTSVGPGDHVLLSFASCGACRSCLSGLPTYCDEFDLRNFFGREADGTSSATATDGTAVGNRWFGQSSFAAHAVTTERNCVVVDSELPLEILGPLGCGLQTGAGAVFNEMRLRPGQSIAVFGAGAVGLAAVMAAKIAGASEIVVVDLNDARLETALALGATRVVDGEKDDLVEQVVGGGPGLDFSFETTSATSVISASIAVLGKPGTAVLVGAGAGELSIAPPLLSGKHVTFVIEGNAVPQLLLPELIAFWKAGRFPFDTLVRAYPLDEIDKAEADSLSGATIKPVLLPQHATDRARTA